MIEQLPNWINLVFLATTMITIGLFHIANNRPWKVTSVIIILAILQSILSYVGFYQKNDGFPPRFVLLLLPSIAMIIYGLRKDSLAWLEKHRNQQWSTFLHIVRIPVEIILLFLFMHDMIPELMTFEGRNFDILAGLTAPIMVFLLAKNKLSRRALAAWNVICLCLVSFIVVNALLSAELPFQQFAFDQPNKAIIYFPFALLPAIIVPIVIHTHISDFILQRRKVNP